MKKVKDSEMFTTALKGKNITLPLGIKKTVGNTDIIICLDSLVITSRYAYAVMYVIIEDTKNNKTLAFWGKDIRFTKKGGLTGDARLELLQTYDLAFGNKIKVSFLVDATHKNFVVFNCDGFKHLHVDAKTYFSRELFLPENADGTIKPSGQVTAEFMTDLVGFNDWVVQIANVPSFQVKGMEGTSFAVKTIAFDRSSFENPTGITFPANYDYPGFAPGVSPTMWEGFYVNGLTVTLPKEFKLKNNGTKRISFSVEKALIDKLGFTGTVAVNNLLAMGEAQMVSWDYSLDYIGVTFLKSTPTGASFRGKIKVPINKEAEYFKYNAIILPDNKYEFTVSTATQLTFPLWGMGQIDIFPDSRLDVNIEGGNFTPTALLSGKCTIGTELNGSAGSNNTSKEDNSMTLASITFQKLLITTKSPYLDIAPGGGISLGASSQKMAKMPVCLEELGFVKGEAGSEKIGIRVGLKVNLLGQSDPGTFAAGAVVTIWGKRNASSNKWEYANAELNELSIDVDISAVYLKGNIKFFRDDEVYGSGFAGSIEIQIKAMEGLGMSSNVMFGKKKRAASDDIFRYWYVDANIYLGPARIPILSIININAIGLGAYYGLEPITDGSVKTKFTTKNGVGYIPKETGGLGLKAMLGIEGPTKQVYNGELGLEISFSVTGSLEYIIFTGFVQCVSLKVPGNVTNMADKYKKLQEKTKVTSLISQKDKPADPAAVNNEINSKSGGSIMAEWKMVYNRTKREFSADIDLFVNVASVITGINGNNNAGRISLYVGPSKWYFRLGVPKQPMGVDIIGVAKASTYFVVGHDLPAPEPMPNGHSADFTSSTKGDAGLGKGFGFGTRVEIRGQLGGGIYAYIAGGVGADIFVFNEGQVYCSATGANRGIKDWYAYGQVYVYVKAGVGLDVCIPWFKPTCRCGGCWTVCCRKWCGCREFCGPWLCCWERRDACVKKEWSAQLGVAATFEGIKPLWAKMYIDNPIKSFSIEVGKHCN